MLRFFELKSKIKTKVVMKLVPEEVLSCLVNEPCPRFIEQMDATFENP